MNTRLLALIAPLALTACADAVLESPGPVDYGFDQYVVPPPDKPGTRPTPTPPPEGEVPPEGEIPPEGEGGPDDLPKPPEAMGEGEGEGEAPPPTGCQDVDYLGVCHGTLAVWCEDNELWAYDCAEDGQQCGFIDDQIGYYCLPGSDPSQPPPEAPPEGQPDPPPPDPGMVDPCPGVDWFGRCEGNTAIWCDDEEEIITFDCTVLGMVCRNTIIFGNRCVLPEDNNMGQTPAPDPGGGNPGG